MRYNNARYLTSASRECCDFAASSAELLTCCPGYCNKFFLYGWAWPSKAVINVSLGCPYAPNSSERGKSHSSTAPAEYLSTYSSEAYFLQLFVALRRLPTSPSYAPVTSSSSCPVWWYDCSTSSAASFCPLPSHDVVATVG